jgi:two-component sensor histidine kinase
MPLGGPNSERALVLALRRRDGEVARRVLSEAGFVALVCEDADHLAREMRRGTGFAVLTEEIIDGSTAQMMYNWIKEQPAWSDLPMIVLTGKTDAPARNQLARELQDILGNITFLERPFHPSTLISVSRAALRSRRRQYEARELLERYELLAAELQHRTKNLLTVILSIATASLREDGDGKALIARLHALAKAQDLLMEGDGRGAYLADVVLGITSSFGNRVTLAGPQVHLRPSLAQGFALIVHELATNAAKHGALSDEDGSVAVSWSVGIQPDQATILFKWQERGGPPALPPERKGFGMVLLERAVASAGSAPRFDYTPKGFTYELTAALER